MSVACDGDKFCVPLRCARHPVHLLLCSHYAVECMRANRYLDQPSTTPEAPATRLRWIRASLMYSPTLLQLLFNVKPSNTFCSAHLPVTRRRHQVAIVVSCCSAALAFVRHQTCASAVDLTGNIGPGGYRFGLKQHCMGRRCLRQGAASLPTASKRVLHFHCRHVSAFAPGGSPLRA